MHVTNPDQTVTLDSVPKVFLHVEVDGVGTCLPDLVEAIIVALERTKIGNVPVLGDRANCHDRDIIVIAKVIQTGKTESAVPVFSNTKPWHGNIEVPD